MVDYINLVLNVMNLNYSSYIYLTFYIVNHQIDVNHENCWCDNLKIDKAFCFILWLLKEFMICMNVVFCWSFGWLALVLEAIKSILFYLNQCTKTLI